MLLAHVTYEDLNFRLILCICMFFIDHLHEADKVFRDMLQHSNTGRILLELTPRQIRSYVHDLIFLEYDVDSDEHEVCIFKYINFISLQQVLCSTFITYHTCVVMANSRILQAKAYRGTNSYLLR